MLSFVSLTGAVGNTMHLVARINRMAALQILVLMQLTLAVVLQLAQLRMVSLSRRLQRARVTNHAVDLL